ncbi:hypothetical protein, partial [Sphingomonas sp. 10B4]|uniref:hypothetical protein n=1 Tax=Sphingomonas sp. 10B4 TaxID=3048575 RepID=UPI002B237C5A
MHFEEAEIEPAVDRTARGEGDHQRLAARRIGRGTLRIAVDRPRARFERVELGGERGLARRQRSEFERGRRNGCLVGDDDERRLAISTDRDRNRGDRLGIGLDVFDYEQRGEPRADQKGDQRKRDPRAPAGSARGCLLYTS